MKYLAMALATAALTGAQTPGISIRPNTTGSSIGSSMGSSGPTMAGSHLGAPILGYVTGPGPLDLRMLVGTGKGAQVGGFVTLPSGVNRLFVPPREHYLLLAKTGAPIAVWQPQTAGTDGTPLTAVVGNPDKVIFSARGDAAVLTTKNGDFLQVIAGLPAEPVVSAQTPIGKGSEALRFAVSDDGQVLVASLTDGSAVVSVQGGEWQRLPAAYGAQALLFVARTHSLVVSDAGQQTLTLVTNMAESTQTARILAHNISADRLAMTREGDVLVAASTEQGKVWMVDLKTMTAGPAASSLIDTLLPLRDGHTFMLSAAGLALLTVPVDSNSATSPVPVTR